MKQNYLLLCDYVLGVLTLHTLFNLVLIVAVLTKLPASY